MSWVFSMSAQGSREDWQLERNRRNQAMVDSLKLDSLQTILFLNVQEQYFVQIEALRNKYPGQRDKIFEERRRFAVARDNEIKGILSDEQWKKYEYLLSVQKERRGRSRPQ